MMKVTDMLDETDRAGHGRDGALLALQESAEAADATRFGVAIDAFESDDYGEIIRLAWRYQFDDDRSKFKRELRELQEHVSEQILARLEMNE